MESITIKIRKFERLNLVNTGWSKPFCWGDSDIMSSSKEYDLQGSKAINRARIEIEETEKYKVSLGPIIGKTCIGTLTSSYDNNLMFYIFK